MSEHGNSEPGLTALERAVRDGNRYRQGSMRATEALLHASQPSDSPIIDTDLDEAYAAAGRGVSGTPSLVRSLVEEIRRLQGDRERHLEILEHFSQHQELPSWNHTLQYPLVKLADDAYIAWGGGADAPVSYVMTLAQVRDAGWSAARIAAAEAPDPDTGYLGNRAGPDEVSLTVAAILEAYASREAKAAFRLTPDKAQCYTSCGREDPVTGKWDDTTVYWVPWPPDEVPDQLPDGWRDRF